MKPKTVAELHKYIGNVITVTFKSGESEQGQLGFTKELVQNTIIDDQDILQSTILILS